jgi:hypothetical protein
MRMSTALDLWQDCLVAPDDKHPRSKDKLEGRPARQGASTTPTFLEQTLHVLPGSGQEGFAIHPPEPPQPKPPQPMPILGFRKERLHPDFPFVHGLLVGFGLVVRPHPIQVLLVEMPRDLASMRALGTPGLEGTGETCRNLWQFGPDHASGRGSANIPSQREFESNKSAFSLAHGLRAGFFSQSSHASILWIWLSS